MTWYRLALVVDAAAGTMTSYINGAPVQTLTQIALDGRFALGATALLFADDNQQNGNVIVNSVQMWNMPMTAASIAALGAADADGILIPGATATPTPTNTFTPSMTPTETLTPTMTPVPTDTLAPVPTQTGTIYPTSTPTATETELPTETPTPTVTPTNTATPTNTPLSMIYNWEFNGNLTSSTAGGQALSMGAAAPSSSPSVSYRNVTINQERGEVARFIRGTYFNVPNQITANGGGAM